MSILDVCFGLGYNTSAAIDTILKINPRCEISVIGLEKDESLKEAVASLTTQFSHYKLIQRVYEKSECKEERVRIKLIPGMAENSKI